MKAANPYPCPTPGTTAVRRHPRRHPPKTMPFYRDMELICRGCGEPFIFTAGEQEFYADKGFLHEPTRCPRCRSRRESDARPARPSERKPERREERR